MPDAATPVLHQKRAAQIALATLAAFTVMPLAAQPQPPALPVSAVSDTMPLILREGVGISGVAQGGRRPFAFDAVQALLVSGKWQPPRAGDKVRLPDGTERVWEAVKADEAGAFTGRALGGGGYLYATVDVPRDGAFLLDARGHGAVYVNGELRMGNPYEYAYGRLPVHLRRGVNHLLFTGGRGKLTASLLPLGAQTVVLNTDDPTLPDVLMGETGAQWGAVIVVNPSDTPLTGLQVTASVPTDGNALPHEEITPVPTIAPYTSRKVGFRFAAPLGIMPGEAKINVAVYKAERSTRRILAGGTLPIRIMRPNEIYKRTFVSQIDGSVQYYAVNPAQKPSPSNVLILSLHGASVEALGQAQAYGTKDWATLVAPTNRRPFGFDWEDWGRLDALEVLEIARRAFPHDPARVSLTGHSMGGHGTWSIGSLFPDQFAAIGPSAGWISFATYAGGTPSAAPTTATETLLARGTNLSDTLGRGTNLLALPIYIVHGDADDNVPVEQARQMQTYLAAQKHPQVEFHEEKGAGHWWDVSPAPGADCVDWAPMFARFETARIPATPSEVNFTTPDPAVSARSHWVSIEQQEQALLPSRVHLTFDAASMPTLRGTTENVHRLALLPGLLPNTPQRYVVLWEVKLDGQTLRVPPGAPQAPLYLTKTEGRWKMDRRPMPMGEKNPDRGSGFKSAFRNRFVLLYGTVGTAEENAWAYARARYDAEAFWYRGNGSCDLLPDTAYKTDTFAGRNVILYGHADMNRAWRDLLGTSPIQARRGQIQVGKETRRGDDLACLFLRPRPGTTNALVGAVCGTGMPGLHLTDRLPVFVSGVVYPDWVIADTTVLADTTRGIVGAGYFGNDWKVDAAQSAWRLGEP